MLMWLWLCKEINLNIRYPPAVKRSNLSDFAVTPFTSHLNLFSGNLKEAIKVVLIHLVYQTGQTCKSNSMFKDNQL